MVLFLASNIWSPAAIFHWNICLVLQWRKFKGLSRISRIVEDFKDFGATIKRSGFKHLKSSSHFPLELSLVSHWRKFKGLSRISTKSSIFERKILYDKGDAWYRNIQMSMKSKREDLYVHITILTEYSYALMRWYFHKTSRTL